MAKAQRTDKNSGTARSAVKRAAAKKAAKPAHRKQSGYVTLVVDRTELSASEADSVVIARTALPDVVLERDVRLDAKRRATLTGAEFDHYHMTVQADGTIVLEPRVLAPPADVTPRVLEMMDAAMENLKAGRAGEAVDFERYADLLEEG